MGREEELMGRAMAEGEGLMGRVKKGGESGRGLWVREERGGWEKVGVKG